MFANRMSSSFWWSIPLCQVFHIKLGSPQSTFNLPLLLVLPTEMQSTWTTSSEGTWTQSRGFEATMTPPTSAGQAAPLHFGERRAPANRVKEVPASSLGTGTKPKQHFSCCFHLSWMASFHFCKGQAVFCRTFCHCTVVAFLKPCRQSPSTDFPPSSYEEM